MDPGGIEPLTSHKALGSDLLLPRTPLIAEVHMSTASPASTSVTGVRMDRDMYSGASICRSDTAAALALVLHSFAAEFHLADVAGRFLCAGCCLGFIWSRWLSPLPLSMAGAIPRRNLILYPVECQKRRPRIPHRLRASFPNFGVQSMGA